VKLCESESEMQMIVEDTGLEKLGYNRQKSDKRRKDFIKRKIGLM